MHGQFVLYIFSVLINVSHFIYKTIPYLLGKSMKQRRG